MYICDRILYFILHYSSIQDSLNCYIVNKFAIFRLQKLQQFYLQIIQTTVCIGRNNLSLIMEIWHVRSLNQLFMLTFGFPLETYITKQLV